ncbi:hypothetical protein PRVXH_001813 [Proteinivorax hydrogeniformans]|uniref:LITAF domain-containing protein n=1 Tax=Proteinivorax hydrogeniformans TaxID=1826727 RepID=A0AAU8HQR1_9FIRM
MIKNIIIGEEVRMGCPNCKSENIQVINEVDSKGYGAGKGCLGYLIFGPFGFLCGLCGMGKTKNNILRVCGSCGTKFK